jgi:hypothetical protein
VAKIGSIVALDNVEHRRMRVACLIKPDAFIESDAVNNKSISILFGPVPAIPTRIRIFWMTAVQIHLMEAGAFIVIKDYQVVVALDRLESGPKRSAAPGRHRA